MLLITTDRRQVQRSVTCWGAVTSTSGPIGSIYNPMAGGPQATPAPTSVGPRAVGRKAADGPGSTSHSGDQQKTTWVVVALPPTLSQFPVFPLVVSLSGARRLICIGNKMVELSPLTIATCVLHNQPNIELVS